MDTQCDKCGKELPTMRELGEPFEPEEAEHRVGWHVVLGGYIYIPPGDEFNSEWEPNCEYTLCSLCRAGFLEVWRRWYGKEE